jgi:hypothetical protein
MGGYDAPPGNFSIQSIQSEGRRPPGLQKSSVAEDPDHRYFPFQECSQVNTNVHVIEADQTLSALEALLDSYSVFRGRETRHESKGGNVASRDGQHWQINGRCFIHGTVVLRALSEVVGFAPCSPRGRRGS